MSTKAIQNENKNMVMDNGVEKTQEQYVNDNITSVPRMWKNRFVTWSLDEQVAHIQKWIANKQNIEAYQERQKLENKVKVLFEQKQPSTEEVLNVIDFCKSYIDNIKAQEISKIDEEIQRLTTMKSQLEKN